MSSLREVRDGFKEIISENEKVIEELEAEGRGASREKDQVAANYMKQLSAAVATFFHPDVDRASINALTKFHPDKSDLVAEYDIRTQQTREAESKMAQLLKIHGSEDALAQRLEEKNVEIKRANEEKGKIENAVNTLNTTLKAVDEFNKTAELKGEMPIQEDTADSFKGKGFSRWMLDGHYRKGRALVMSDEGIPERLKARELEQENILYATAEIKALDQEKRGIQTIIDGFTETRQNIVSGADIRSDIAAKMVGMFSNETFFNKAVSAMPTKFPAALVEERAKMNAFDKIGGSLNLRAAMLRKATGNLSTHMPKLNRVVSNGVGYRQAPTIDLQKMQAAFRSQRNAATYVARQMVPIQSAVRNFRTSPTTAAQVQNAGTNGTPLEFCTNMMIYGMLFGAGEQAPDAFAVNTVFSIPEGMAAEGGIDLGSLAPHVSTDDIGLTQQFNVESGVSDAGTFDAGSFSMDAGSTFDAGGFGSSFDSGGSSYGGGGFDGGGGSFDGGGGF